MEVENELKALRYLINNLILYVYDMRLKLNDIAPSNKRYMMGEPNPNGNNIKFDLFMIPTSKYKVLVEKYGVDIVNRACVKLDEFIKINEYIPFRHPSIAIQRRFIGEVLNEEYKNKTE